MAVESAAISIPLQGQSSPWATFPPPSCALSPPSALYKNPQCWSMATFTVPVLQCRRPGIEANPLAGTASLLVAHWYRSGKVPYGTSTIVDVSDTCVLPALEPLGLGSWLVLLVCLEETNQFN